MNPINVTLRKIIEDWLAQSTWTTRYAFIEGDPPRIVCRCCRLIRIKIYPDKISYATQLRTNKLFTKHELVPAAPNFFDEIARVLQEAEHDSAE